MKNEPESSLRHAVTRDNVTSMAFVKLDCGLLDSTLWVDRDAREIFLTCLLMAEPREFRLPSKQIEIRSVTPTGFEAPAGWYGFVPAASTGIIRRAGMSQEAGMAALERLGGPDPESRTPNFDGRRLIRIDGGFLILNYMKYRERDYSSAERSKRYRERKLERKALENVTMPRHAVTSRSVTQAEVEGDAEVEAEAPTHTNREDLVCVVIEHHRKAHPSMVHSIEPVKALIRDRLRDGFSVDDLKKAIDGQARGRFYKGDNEAKTPFLSMGYLFENDDRVRRAMAEVDKAGPSKEQLAADAKKRDEEILRISEAARLRVIPPPAAPPRSP